MIASIGRRQRAIASTGWCYQEVASIDSGIRS